MKIILDTNIYISSFVFDSHVENFYLEILKKDEIDIYFSDETFDELVKKLDLKEFSSILAKSKRLIGRIDIDSFIQNIKTNSIIISDPTEKVVICRDPNDNKFLELAKAIQADYIISGDKDLLDLSEFEGVRIVKPSEFLVKID